jgi:hypothetical protein
MWKSIGLAGAVLGCVSLLAGQSHAQETALFVCGAGLGAFVVAGPDGAPGCRRVAEPVDELRLSPPEPDLAEILDRLSAQSQRIERLERAIMGAQMRRSVRPTFRPAPDPFDTQGRTRDLGQDIDRALDELSR